MIKQVFTGDPDIFHAGEANATPLEPLMGRNSVLLLDGPEHMRQRKLMLPSFHGERMQRYGDADARDRRARRSRAGRSGEPFGLRPRTQAITLEIIMRTVFGIDDAERLARLSERLAAMLDIGMQSRALAAIALPQVRRTIGRGIWKRFLRLRAAADAEIYDEIARRRRATDIEERDDVLSILLQARDEDGRADDRRGAARRADDAAGRRPRDDGDRRSRGRSSCCCATRPQLARLQAEIEAGDGDGEYLDAVIKETLRIRPVVPGRDPQADRAGRARTATSCRPARASRRTSTSPTAARTCIPEPERFRPERFLERRRADTYSWIPFGGGIRRCLGASFALYEMKIVIPAILRGVQLRAAGAEPERIRRRAITFVPEHDAQVVVESVRDAAGPRRPAVPPDAARSSSLPALMARHEDIAQAQADGRGHRRHAARSASGSPCDGRSPGVPIVIGSRDAGRARRWPRGWSERAQEAGASDPRVEGLQNEDAAARANTVVLAVPFRASRRTSPTCATRSSRRRSWSTRPCRWRPRSAAGPRGRSACGRDRPPSRRRRWCRAA